MQVKLKPCPFCGGEAAVAYYDGFPIVRCNSCGCGTGFSLKGDVSVLEAAWNTRHQFCAEVVGEIVAWLRENDVYKEWREGAAIIEAKFGGKNER